MSEEQAALNTDREIYREVEGDYYSPSISVTQSGAIQLNVGGLVIGKTITEWHDLVSKCQSCGGSMFYGPEAKENHTVACQHRTSLLTKLREEVMKDKELTETEVFMRDMPKMFCGCSFSGYVKCEEHKDIPIPERTFTRSEVLALIDKELI